MYYNNGNIGIGTSTPLGPLQVYGANTYLSGLNIGYGTGMAVITTDVSNKVLSLQLGGTEYARIHANGYFGIGTSYPSARLSALIPLVTNAVMPLGYFGSSNTSDNRSVSIQQIGNSSTSTQYLFLNGGLGSNSVFGTPVLTSTYAPSFGLESSDNNLNIITAPMGANQNPIRAMSFLPSGNVLIGKTTQANSSYILDVNGFVRANKLIVNTNGADFVFDSTYKLQDLQTVETFIKDNHHLPGVAPAKQMQVEGLDVGDNQTVLLSKIEELTLYLLQQQKELNAQQKELKAQQEKIAHLQQLLEQKMAK